ncbi:MAG: type II toxin-antitoxin system VapC family toxin [Bacteroidota bacterium]
MDTHVLVWYLAGDKQLSEKALELIEDSSNEIRISLASYWEMSIKINLNKLKLPLPLEDLISLAKEKQILTENITEGQILKLADLAYHHKDPFDQLIVVQGMLLNCPVISADKKLDAYEINRIW